MMRLRGIHRNERNVNFCNRCDAFIQAHPGGAEVELSMVFADVKGSTDLAEKLHDDTAYTRIINERFKSPVRECIMRTYGFINDQIGDSVFAVYPPGFSGPQHAQLALNAARELLRLNTGPDAGQVLPFRVAVHFGSVRIGTTEDPTAPSVGSGSLGVLATGRRVNTLMHLSKKGGTDEALMTEAICTAAQCDIDALEHREITVEGMVDPVSVYAMAA